MSDLLYSPHGVPMMTDTVEFDLESRTPRYFCSYSLDFVPIALPPNSHSQLSSSDPAPPLVL